jgi:hypothetical protein
VVVADGLSDDEACRHAGGEWHCRIAPGEWRRIVAVYDSADSDGDRYARGLEIYPESGSVGRQSFEAGVNAPGELGPLEVTVRDLDGDGFRDLRLRSQIGIPANEGHTIWRFRPATRQFVLDSLLSGETNVAADGVGCVRTFASYGHGGLSHSESRYCLVGRDGGRWVEVRRREQHYDDRSETVSESIWERRGDALVLVREGPVLDW